MDGNYLNGLGEYLRRSGRNLAELPGQLSENLSELPSRAGNALSGMAGGAHDGLADLVNSVPHIPYAEDGIRGLNGALTGYDTPSYGDDEISAAREYFDRGPRSNTSRLIDLLQHMPQARGFGLPRPKLPPATQQAVTRAAPTKAPVPSELDEAKAIMEELKRSRAEWEATRGY
jgi:hypothetical protein